MKRQIINDVNIKKNITYTKHIVNATNDSKFYCTARHFEILITNFTEH